MGNGTTTLVLVADDEPATLAMVSSHLRSRGYKVIEAADGDEAWELAHEHLPHVVLLDVMMPGMSGWEVCRRIRETVSLAHTGIIMLTGIGETLNEMTSPLYGADAHIDKPFEFSELDKAIEETLERRQAGAIGRPDAADVMTLIGDNGASELDASDDSAEDLAVDSIRRVSPDSYADEIDSENDLETIAAPPGYSDAPKGGRSPKKSERSAKKGAASAGEKAEENRPRAKKAASGTKPAEGARADDADANAGRQKTPPKAKSKAKAKATQPVKRAGAGKPAAAKAPKREAPKAKAAPAKRAPKAKAAPAKRAPKAAAKAKRGATLKKPARVQPGKVVKGKAAPPKRGAPAVAAKAPKPGKVVKGKAAPPKRGAQAAAAKAPRQGKAVKGKAAPPKRGAQAAAAQASKQGKAAKPKATQAKRGAPRVRGRAAPKAPVGAGTLAKPKAAQKHGNGSKVAAKAKRTPPGKPKGSKPKAAPVSATPRLAKAKRAKAGSRPQGR